MKLRIFSMLAWRTLPRRARSRSRINAAAALLALLPGTSSAVVANFTDGNGTILPDQWAGAAGDGWAGPWDFIGNAPGTGVVSTSPLHGGADYLQFIDNTTSTQFHVRRQYESFGELDITQPYRITLSYRYDGSQETFTEFTDRIAIFGDTNPQGGSNAANTWLIGVAGSNSGAGTGQSVFPGEWYFFDNNGSNSFATGNMFDTDLAFVAGRDYAITIDVNPILGTYSPSIDDGVNPVVSATDLTFRRGAGPAASSWFHIVHNSNVATDSASFSLDNLTIVPEPSAITALLLGAGAIITRRRRS